MKTIAQIETFILLADMKNFNKVADKLDISTTAVSKQIKALEKNLDKQLFIRTTRKVELTEFGELFLLHCRELMEKVEDIEAFITLKKNVPQGKLKIICSLTLGKDLLLKYLPQFIEKYPLIDLVIEFSEDTRTKKFENWDIHFAFADDVGFTDNMRYRKLFTVSQLLCASPNYLKKYKKISTIDDLIDHKFITLNLRKPNNEIKLVKNKIVKTPTPSIIMNNFSALTEACVSGMGILLIGDYIAKPYLESGKLVKVLPDLSYKKFDIYLFYRAMKYELPKVKAFVDFYSNKIHALT